MLGSRGGGCCGAVNEPAAECCNCFVPSDLEFAQKLIDDDSRFCVCTLLLALNQSGRQIFCFLFAEKEVYAFVGLKN